MNFEDEEYIRVYSKKTNTFKKLGWEGRLVFWHLLIEADRAGVIELDESDDEVESVAALIDVPAKIVRIGLERLASRGVTTRHGASLIIEKFVEAQNARRSDRLRAQDYRDRKRNGLPPDSSTSNEIPEENDTSSRGVTQRHDSSQPVTIRHSLPPLPSPPHSPASPQTLVEFALDAGGLEAPSEPLPSPSDAPSGDLEAPSEPLEPENPKPDPMRAKARLVFETWKLDTGHHRAVLDRKREARIVARLRDGFTPEQLLQAIQNRRNDSWLTGERSGRVYDGIETLLRDRAQVERLLELTAPVPTRGQQRLPAFRQPDSGYRPSDHATEIT